MKIVIIEDEPISATALATLIESYDKSHTIEKIIDTITESVQYLKSHHPDLLFMDIELADGISFEIFNQVSISCPIIFTTAYDQYAIKAFEQNSVSYLLKPITGEKLASAFFKLEKINRLHLSDIQKLLKYKGEYKTSFLVKSGNKLIPIKSDEIAYFYSEDNLVFIVTNTIKKYLGSHTLNQLEEMLDPAQFFRLNRQYIVQRDNISHLEPYTKGQVRVHLISEFGVSAIVSRQKTPLLKEWLT